MERDHEFIVRLPDATYAIKLFEGVHLDKSNEPNLIGRWPAFDLQATGDAADDVYQKLLLALQKQVGEPGTAEFEPFAAYVRDRGTPLSDEDVAARELAQLRDIAVRWHVTDDEQYTVRLFQEVEVQREGDNVTARAFGLEGGGPNVTQAVQALNGAIDEACGKHDAPGARFDELTNWVRSNGERVSEEILAQEAEDERSYVVARDKLTAITPDDISAESSTGVPLLVDFWAAWCGPCRMVTPVLAELAEQWAGRIVMRKIDVDQFDGIWQRFDFRGIPAMLMFKDGKEIHRVIGFGGKKHLVAQLEPHLA